MAILPARLSGLNAPLITSQKRGPFSPNSLCQMFAELYRHAGINLPELFNDGGRMRGSRWKKIHDLAYRVQCQLKCMSLFFRDQYFRLRLCFVANRNDLLSFRFRHPTSQYYLIYLSLRHSKI